jgi:hypothetical protein
MKTEVDLKKIQEALDGENAAIKKRALAIILNESVIEAKAMVARLATSDPDSETRVLASRVAQKLESLEKSFSQASLETILEAFQKADQRSRVLALRGLLHRQSKFIPRLIREFFHSETQPETSHLIVEIIKNNPDFVYLDQLAGYLKHPVDDVRFKAFEAMEKSLLSVIYPEMLRTLLDPCPKLKMRGYHFLGRIGRARFSDILTEMLRSPNRELSRLAGNLATAFLGRDLVPVLKPHLQHADGQTAALCQKSMETLAGRGFSEACVALGIPGFTAAIDSGTADTPLSQDLEKIRELVLSFPPWMLGDLAREDSASIMIKPIQAMKEVFFAARDFLAFTFFSEYLAVGERDPGLDLGCLRAIRRGPRDCNVIQLIQALAHALPKPTSTQDLFPRLIAQSIFVDDNETFLEQIMSFQEVFQLVDQNPGEAESLLIPTLEGFSSFLNAISAIKNNKLVVKVPVGGMNRYYDFNTTPISAIEPQLLANFELPLHCPTLVSGDFEHALPLSPYLVFQSSPPEVNMQLPQEEQLLEYLSRNAIMQDYLDSIVDSYAAPTGE